MFAKKKKEKLFDDPDQRHTDAETGENSFKAHACVQEKKVCMMVIVKVVTVQNACMKMLRPNLILRYAEALA